MKRKSILLIEDDMWLADSYHDVIVSHGFACNVVVNAEEAMDIIDQDLPVVIVADVMLGDHTVFSLLHELQSYDDTQKIPVIICSSLARSAAHLQEQLHEYGVVEVLDKATVTPEELVTTIEEYS